MARLPDIEGEQSKLTNILRAMGNAKRMRILNELSDGRERSVSELEGIMSSLSQPPCRNIWRACDAPISSRQDANPRPYIIQSTIPMYCGFSASSDIYMMMIR